MQERNKPTYLLGYSGHAFVVAEAALLNGLKITGYLNANPVELNPFNLAYKGSEYDADFEGWLYSSSFLLGIGCNQIRKKVATFIRSKGGELPTIIHPKAVVSNYTSLGEGTTILGNATINPFCEVGENVIVNTSASIDHECRLENNSHIAPGAVLAGNVYVGESTFIGANAVIREGVKISSNCIIGSGAVVLEDIPLGAKVVGNPGKIISQ